MSNHDDLLPEFLAEITELVENARTELARLESLPAEQRLESLNAIFRAVHSIKGGSSVFEFNQATQIAHRMESLLDRWRKDPTLYTPKGGLQVGKILDTLETLIQNGDQTPNARSAPVTSTVTELPLASLDNLSQELNAVAQENSSPTEVSPPAAPLLAAVPAPSRSVTQATAKKEYLRIASESVQKTLDIISELFLVRNQMRYLIEQFEDTLPAGFGHAWDMLDNSMRRNIGELESVSMGMRMVTLDNLFARLEKTVDSYLGSSEKKIRVEKLGGDTELDKKVIDALSDSLLHLIRNSMDHGIETVTERRAKNKPDEGTIRLSADVLGNEVLIKISDDGKGISAERVLNAARSKGLDTSHVRDTQSAIELIFVPGFSTVSQVTETSGRGVGMDVVKSSVERLNGTVQLSTTDGQGTEFEIRLPLSLSVVSTLIATINQSTFAFSTKDIVETLRVTPDMVLKNGAETFLNLRDTLIPCYALNEWIGPRAKNGSAPPQRYRSEIPVCIVRDASKRYALVLDRLESNTELVVKPAPTVGPKLSYVTGVAVLPTGQPIFVLSLSRLVREKTATLEGAVHAKAA